MPDYPSISHVRFARASVAERQRGLLGWVSFAYGGLVVDGVAVRKTRDGRIVLSFPLNHSKSGRQHAILRPADARARSEIERAVLGALGPNARGLEAERSRGQSTAPGRASASSHNPPPPKHMRRN